MTKVDFYGLPVPDGFPIAEYSELLNNGLGIIGDTQEVMVEFSRAIKASIYRYISFIELIKAMVGKWDSMELYPSHREIYEQEKDLLHLFVNGISSIESAYYSIYILATQLNPKKLDFNNLEKRKYGHDPRFICKELKQSLGNVPVLTTIRAIDRSRMWKIWNEYRNMMFHSVAAPRVHRLSVSSNPPKPAVLDYGKTWCTSELLADREELQGYVNWLSEKLRRLWSDSSKLKKVP
jgi:hypothetical protein